MAMSVEAMLTNNAQGDGESAARTAQEDVPAKIESGYGPKQTLAVERAQQLANLILQEPHRFALQGDRQLQDVSLEALKSVFDLALDTEGPAIPSIAATLHSTFPDDENESAPTPTRQKRKRSDGPAEKAQHASHRLFEPTPLSVLTTEGMQAAQLWEQLELRNSKICTLLDAVIVTEQEGAAGEEEDESEEEDLDDLSASPLDEAERIHKRQRAGQTDEEVAVHNLKQLSDAEIRALGLDPELVREDDDEFEGDDDEDEEDDDEDYGYPGASDLSDDDEYSGVIITEPLLSEEDQQKRKAEAEAQERRELRSRRRLAKMMQNIHGVPGEDEDDVDDDADDEDEDEDFEEGDEEDDQEDEDDDDEDSSEEASSRPANRSDKSNLNQILSDRIKIRRNAELDDSFFSIDQFNHDTEKYGNEDTSLGDDVDLFRSMEREEEAEQDQPLYYGDFFAPPPFQASKGEKKATKDVSSPAQSAKKDAKVHSAEKGEEGLTRSRSSVRFNEEVSVLRIKARRDKEMEITPELLQLLQQQGGGNSNGDDDMEGIDADDFEEEDDDEEEEELDSEMNEENDEEGDESDDESEGERSLMDEEEDEELEVDEQEDELNVDANGKLSFEDASDDSDAERDTARRVAGDLFADDESNDGSDRSDDDENGKVSEHQRRVQLLQQEIAQLERENVGKKDWTLMGEAGSRVRPENSLLEEDVEFESNRKAKPVNTPETTQTLEEMIKKRILDDNFDDVVRRANLQPIDFLPSKMLELSDAKNPKSLDQIYEDEMNGTGDEQGAKLDKELQKEHEEIDQLYDQLEAQLDALSNAHFTPKAPKLTVKTISNAPTISLEESLPSTMSHGAQLAPEEVYDAGSRNAAFEGSSSELTPEEKQRRHRQLRDEKRARNERIAQHKRNVEINREAFGQHRGGRFVGGSGGGKKAAAEKDEALKKLIGNKGVSVVGKGDQANGKAGHRQKGQNGAAVGANASHLKL